MIRSMTGYGEAEKEVAGFSLRVELRSLNHRFLDISLKLPQELSSYEELIRGEVKKRISRGRIDIFVSLKPISGKVLTLEVNEEAVREVADSLKKLKKEAKLSGKVDINTILRLPGLIELKPKKLEDSDELKKAVEETLSSALSLLEEARVREGEALSQAIATSITKIEEEVRGIEEGAPKIQEELYQRLKERLSALAPEVSLDEKRLFEEAVYYTDRFDITEELTRLKAHLAEMRRLLSATEPVGRKLDFLIQELNRETNTLGSKVKKLDFTKGVLSIKSEIEKIREQAQNIE
ncbi:MAG: YicC family protein [Acidobacteria bacterium]|nr:YicC family protein [Acidobacteriota bacterium]